MQQTAGSITIKTDYDGYVHRPAEPADYPCIAFVNAPAAPLFPGARAAHATLLRMLRAEAEGAGASEADLRRFNRRLARLLRRRHLVTTVRGFGWDWTAPPTEPLEREWQVLWSAARLLTGTHRDRMRACPGCSQLYLDQSRNRSRHWCDMQTCGNRAKQRKWRARN